MTEFEMKQEDKKIIEYTRYVLSLGHVTDDSTMLFLNTKSFGILTPSIILNWIDQGVIIVINNDNKKVA